MKPPNRQGRSPSCGPDVEAAACWKMRSAACLLGCMRQPGTTQGLAYQHSARWPRWSRQPPSLPACLPTCHLGACWVTLTTGPSEGNCTLLQGKEGGSMGNEALPCKWSSFQITPATHRCTHKLFYFCLRGDSLYEKPLRSSWFKKEEIHRHHGHVSNHKQCKAVFTLPNQIWFLSISSSVYIFYFLSEQPKSTWNMIFLKSQIVFKPHTDMVLNAILIEFAKVHLSLNQIKSSCVNQCDASKHLCLLELRK